MPPFKDDQIIIIAPGSQTTLAQLGLPESFTPAKLRIRSCMFPGLKKDQWEPYAINKKQRHTTETPSNDQVNGAQPANGTNNVQNGVARLSTEAEEDAMYEEDRLTDEGAVWPIQNGQITNWSCFFALMTHVCNSINLNAVFYSPILLISQPCWTNKDHETITEFFFEKFKVPAFSILDSAVATLYAYGASSAAVIDVGKSKADVTAMTDFVVHETGRLRAIPDCGGDAMTKQLHTLLESKGFTVPMCEELKKSPICEILPAETPIPGSEEATIPSRKGSIVDLGGGGGDVDDKDEAESEGVLDVASLVTGGGMTEYLERREREKAEKAAAKKKGTDNTQGQQRPARLPNSRREKNTFMYHDRALMTALKGMNLGEQGLADAQAALDETAHKTLRSPETAEGPGLPLDGQMEDVQDANGAPLSATETTGRRKDIIRREVEVGLERFKAADGGILELLADSIHRVISSVEEHQKRGDIWDCLLIVGNGSKVRGFKEALMSILQTKYIISPSSGTIFTSELPSNITTPTGTGANTPQPQSAPHPGGGAHSVNPLLLAATTAQNPHLNPVNISPGIHQSHNIQSPHGQSPTSVKYGKVPEYFPEWKEAGFDEAMFLGGQIAAKVIFISDPSGSKNYMTRTDFNDMGPLGIHDFVL